jgi:UDP-3-O-[3-hydroxymyristoyl] glucosamine N-acyltransferase
MEFTALQIASFLKGEVIGDQNVKINNVSKIEKGEPGTLTFLANPKYEPYIYETKASVVLVNRTFKPNKEIKATQIRVEDAYKSLALLMDLYTQSIPTKKGIEEPSFISPSANVGENTYIGAFAYIDEQVTIGANVQIHPHCWIGKQTVIKDNSVIFAGVKLYPETKIGEGCIIHAGAVIGADGFGFAPQEDGTYKKLNQIGHVIIEDDVEIGANTTIDCATMGATIIHKGAKIDNLVQIGHNVEVGDNTVIASQAGIAGSSSVGKNCIIAGQVGIAGHLKLGNRVTLAGKTGVNHNLEDNSTHMGQFSIDAKRFRRAYAVFKNLPEVYRDLNKMKREVDKLIAE